MGTNFHQLCFELFIKNDVSQWDIYKEFKTVIKWINSGLEIKAFVVHARPEFDFYWRILCA